VLQPGPLHAFYERAKARRGHGKAIVATARKLAILFWCMLTRSKDYAHQQPCLTRKKLRRLEITAGAPKNTPRAAGIWSTNEMMHEAELELARQTEVSYKRTVTDQHAGAPARTACAGGDTGARMNKALEGQSRAADHKLLTSALRFVSHPRLPTT
jgi:transposase